MAVDPKFYSISDPRLYPTYIEPVTIPANSSTIQYFGQLKDITYIEFSFIINTPKDKTRLELVIDEIE